MPEIDLSLARVRRRPNLGGTDFESDYAALMMGHELTQTDLVFLLSRAILFLRSNDTRLHRLGYRILLQHATVNGDFEPLHQVAVAKDYIPVATAIERGGLMERNPDSFATVLWQAHLENFAINSGGVRTYRTKGQMRLRTFANQESGRLVVVAPTSYGKSEMITDKVVSNLGKRICILVPSKALIAQTKRMLLSNNSIREARALVLTHPDSVVDPASSFIAVLTQERLARLLSRHPELTLDVLLVDEAHNALGADARSEHLVQTLMAARHRSGDLQISYFTPFVANHKNLTLLNDDEEVEGLQIDEYVKIEKIHYTKLDDHELYLYDQFLVRPLLLSTEQPSDEFEFVSLHARKKNVLYLNRPRDAEAAASELAQRLPTQESDAIHEATEAIAELIHPDYSLIDCIKSGVAFHHGKVPEVLRQYIEQLFSDMYSGIKFLATTSTLLEGVNTPTDAMFILSPAKGRAYLQRSSFKNLIGRTGRFREVFHPDHGDLALLQPNIYVIDGRYTRDNFNPESFLKRVADVQGSDEDKVSNALLSTATSDADRQKELLQYLENVEPGASGLQSAPSPSTRIGELCFQNHVLDFDIIESEQRLQDAYVAHFPEDPLLQTPSALIDAVVEIFLAEAGLEDDDPLARIRDNLGAQQFYSMFLGWRSEGTPMRVMVGQFLGYWRSLTDPVIFVGSAWGDCTYDGGTDGRLLYVRLSEKSEKERVNLAVAKIKEEQDFIDHRLMKYVEVLNDLGTLSETFYNSLKYGTSDLRLIALLKLGLSMDLARLIHSEYQTFISFEEAAGSPLLQESLLEAMRGAEVNEILLYELECHL